MMIDESYKLFGVFSVLLTWMAIGYVMLTIERDIAKSISHHASQKRKNYIIFCVLMIMSLIAMLIFMVKWFIPAFNLPLFFSCTVMLAVLLELVTTLVPLTHGWRFVSHQVASYGAALLLPVLLFMLTFSPDIPEASIYIVFVSLIAQLVLLSLFFLVPRIRRHYLIYQSMYVFFFHFGIVAVAFL
jgi:hypothetical protein